jgi:hemolysin III
MHLTHDGQSIDRTLDVTSNTLPLRLREEKLNSATHALGFVLSVWGVVWLLLRACHHGNAWQIAGCAVYGASLVAVYAASTLSHAFQQPRLRRLFRILDQAFIFLLIAGTYTPLALSYLRGGIGWWFLFGLIWGIALVGFFSKAVWGHQIDAVSTVLHVTLGWLPVCGMWPMLSLVPSGLLWWMFYGGLCYTAGTFFLQRDERVPFFHAVWHLMVIAGSACHYWGILAYCTGQ